MIQRETGLSHGAVAASLNRLAALCIEIGKRSVMGRDGRRKTVNCYEIIGPKASGLRERSRRPNNFRSMPSTQMEASTTVERSTHVESPPQRTLVGLHAHGDKLRSSERRTLNLEVHAQGGGTAKAAAPPNEAEVAVAFVKTLSESEIAEAKKVIIQREPDLGMLIGVMRADSPGLAINIYTLFNRNPV